MRPRSLAVLIVASLIAPSLAAAEPSKADIAAAKKLFDDAQADEAEGRWASALERLRRIATIKETAGVRFHTALAEERLGQLLAAEADYRRSAELAEKMGGAEGKDIAERCASGLAALAPRIPLITLRVGEAPASLRVTVDGRAVETRGSQPLKHDPGEAVVEARAPGRKPFSKSLVLPEGASLTVDVVLEPEASEAPSPSPSPVAPVAPPPPEARSTPATAYVAGGVAIAGLATGIVFTLNARRLRKETDDTCASPDIITCDPRRDTVIRNYWIGAAAGGVAFVGGAALAGYLTFAGPSSSTVAITPSPGGLLVRGRF